MSFALIPEAKKMDVEIPVRTQYLRDLYAIELLKHLNLQNIDLQIAYQFAKKYNKPWFNNIPMLQSFAEKERPTLSRFIYQKGLEVIRDLLVRTDKFETAEFHPVALEPNLYRSLASQLSDCLHHYKSNPKGTVFTPLYDPWNRMGSSVCCSHQGLNNLELVDSILRGHFNTYHQEQWDISVKDDWFPPMRAHETMDHKVYVPCTTEMFQCGKTWIDRQLDYLQNDAVMFNNFRFWAGLLSVAYRLNIPSDTTPDRLDVWYNRLVRSGEYGPKAIAYVRPLSTVTAEAAIGTELPEIFADLFNLPEDTQSQFGGPFTNPDNPVERYLVCQYLCR